MKTRLSSRCRLEIVGTMPERALLRLRRADIDLYDVKKPKKDAVRLTVLQRDLDKVFAVYPPTREGTEGYTAYSARVLRRMGIAKYLDFAKNRVGFILGACLFCGCVAYADGMVLGVEFSASSVYEREALAALQEYGVTTFSRYETGKEDLICSRLLSLEGVEFCSVKKSGMRVVVEIRLGDLPNALPTQGDMRAKHEGVIVSLTALKGTPQKQVGERVAVGETLVGAWIEFGEEERKETEVMARVSIASTYTGVIAAEDERQAFAIAYLQAEIEDTDRVESKAVQPIEGGYQVTIEYVAIESVNF